MEIRPLHIYVGAVLAAAATSAAVVTLMNRGPAVSTGGGNALVQARASCETILSTGTIMLKGLTPQKTCECLFDHYYSRFDQANKDYILYIYNTIERDAPQDPIQRTYFDNNLKMRITDVMSRERVVNLPALTHMTTEFTTLTATDFGPECNKIK